MENAAAALGTLLKRVGFVAGGIGSLLLFENQFLFNVEPGERVVIFDRFRGVLPEVRGEGTHLRIPILQYPIFFDIRSRPRVINTQTGTRDLQKVSIALRVLSRPKEEMLPTIYSEIGQDYDEKVLPSIGNEVLKAVVAQYNADQLLTMREKISRQISETLEERARAFNLLLDDVSITHLLFGQEFTQAIEFKQVAQQEAERSKFVVMQEEQLKRVKVIEAEGESEAATLISEALQKSGEGLIEVRRIDAAKDIADTLSQARNVTYVPSGNGMLMTLGAGGNTPQ